MKRVTTGYKFAVSLDHLPEPDWAVVRNRVAKAKLQDQEQAFVSFLKSATASYWRRKIRDEMSATPAEVRAYAARLKRVVGKLTPQNDVEATILRAAISPYPYSDLLERLEAVVAGVEALRTDTQDGSGPRLEHARQVGLARQFLIAFRSNAWPLETSANSLLSQLLLVVLGVVGEGRGTIQRILQEADLNT